MDYKGIDMLLQKIEDTYGVMAAYDYDIDVLKHRFAFQYKDYYIKVIVPPQIMADQVSLETSLAACVEDLIIKVDAANIVASESEDLAEK